MRTGAIVDRAVGVLRELVGEREDLLERVFFSTKRFELSFYRNQAIHLFIKEAIVSVSMYATIRRGGSKETQRVSYAELLDEVTFLSRLLKVDFIYPPGTIEDNLKETLRFMTSEIVCADNEYIWLSDRERARGRENFGAFAVPFQFIDALLRGVCRRRLTSELADPQDFYCFLIWPFVDAYWLAVVSMFSLAPLPDPAPEPPLAEVRPAGAGTVPKSPAAEGVPSTVAPPPVLATPPSLTLAEPPWVDDKLFMSRVQLLGRTLYYQGDLTYYEAINKETLKNAYLRLQSAKDEGAVLRVRRPAPSARQQVPAVSLDPRYVPVVNANRHRHDGGDKNVQAECYQVHNWNHVQYSVQPQGALFELMERVGRFRREGRTASSEGIERNKLV
ncbi:MAG: hypothetical protein BJ554DRAFT_6573 [Olpidium bornovanus]|uniref:GPAT/DHAPAT C-terminal domain-containing protein n=1 Tax=Olpidium bornovanus TaxID=278681 RepID=A0A8H8DJW0_9FUNG|nr:MAG: hypothetical protein BJ554DRAFT_6573 [Olpidium bornovanus]